jgi:L-fuculose-phosphate aldolase
VKTSTAILLENHGVVTFGKDLDDALFKMEKVEHAAHIAFVARLLGGERPLSSADVAKLFATFGKQQS